MHEMTHAVASATLANPKSGLAIQMKQLFGNVQGYLGTAYGAKNVDEFFSEAMSNPLFRAELAGINVKGEEVTVLQRFFNVVNNFLSKYVSAIPSRNITLLQEGR